MEKRLVWNEEGTNIYETGISHGVLFVDGKAIAWNGLTSFDEAPGGAEPNKIYADNINYITMISAETFGGTINAYTYPEEFAACNGEKDIVTGINIGQQNRKPFAFAYQTRVGNQEQQTDYGYKIHIVYGCTASPSAKTYETINDSPEAIVMSWEVATTPVAVKDAKPTSKVVIDSTKVEEGIMKKIEDALYGTGSTGGKLLLPDEIVTLLEIAG